MNDLKITSSTAKCIKNVQCKKLSHLMRTAGADPGFFEGGDLGAAEAHLRAPFMRAAHKGCEPSGTGGLGGVVSPPAETQFASISECLSSP